MKTPKKINKPGANMSSNDKNQFNERDNYDDKLNNRFLDDDDFEEDMDGGLNDFDKFEDLEVDNENDY